MDEIRWEDPSAGGPVGRHKWLAVLEPLQAHPKRWARVRDYRSSTQAYSIAANLRTRKTYAPPGNWEFLARRVDSGTWAVYARYLGEGDA